MYIGLFEADSFAGPSRRATSSMPSARDTQPRSVHDYGLGCNPHICRVPQCRQPRQRRWRTLTIARPSPHCICANVRVDVRRRGSPDVRPDRLLLGLSSCSSISRTLPNHGFLICVGLCRRSRHAPHTRADDPTSICAALADNRCQALSPNFARDGAVAAHVRPRGALRVEQQQHLLAHRLGPARAIGIYVPLLLPPYASPSSSRGEEEKIEAFHSRRATTCASHHFFFIFAIIFLFLVSLSQLQCQSFVYRPSQPLAFTHSHATPLTSIPFPPVLAVHIVRSLACFHFAWSSFASVTPGVAFIGFIVHSILIPLYLYVSNHQMNIFMGTSTCEIALEEAQKPRQ